MTNDDKKPEQDKRPRRPYSPPVLRMETLRDADTKNSPQLAELTPKNASQGPAS